ncbi:MAG: HAMP domain-containing sensor histidine kinase [Kiritimatiellae bacterium]|nr:HAMP domain-containing sensor histidine kinase [Kiritimatiellia bacterium]
MATANGLLEMISAILDVSKMEAAELKLCLGDFDVEQVVRRIFAGFKALSRSRAMIFERDASAPAVIRADVSLLTRGLENLLMNAIKFTSETKGIIRVSVSMPGERVRIDVEDNGYGVPPEHRARIFDKYGQVEEMVNHKKYCTGLGLPFCRMAVETHGGTIELKEKGKGSLFRIELPPPPAV